MDEKEEKELAEIRAKQSEDQFRFFLLRCLDNVAQAIKQKRVRGYSTSRVTTVSKFCLSCKQTLPADKEDIEKGATSLRISFEIEDAQERQAGGQTVPADFDGKKE